MEQNIKLTKSQAMAWAGCFYETYKVNNFKVHLTSETGQNTALFSLTGHYNNVPAVFKKCIEKQNLTKAKMMAILNDPENIELIKADSFGKHLHFILPK